MSVRPNRAFALAVVVASIAGTADGQAPSNDACASAIPVADGVNPGAPSGASGSTYTNTGATNSTGMNNVCGFIPFGINIHKDVFFTYFAQCAGTTTVSTCTPGGFASGSLIDTVVVVYDAAAVCPGLASPLACDDDSCGLRAEVSFPTTPGATYLIRVGSAASTSSGTFYLSISGGAAPPNDECGGAAPIFVGFNGGSTACATPSAGDSCTGFTAPVADVWHSFTPAADCYLTVTLTGSGADRIGLYAGGCGGSQTALSCDSAGTLDVATIAAAGTNYWIRVGRGGAPGVDASIGLTVTCEPLATNDECAGAVPLSNGVNPAAPSGSSGVAFSNYGMTESAGFAASCAAGGVPGMSDVFFSYVSPVDGDVRISTCTPPGFSAGTLADTVLEVYPATGCPGGGAAALACNDQFCGSRSEVVFAATFGVAYLVRVGSRSTSATVEGTFYVSVDPVANDDCATAQTVAVGATHGSTFGATPSPDAAPASCPTGFSAGGDVWFRFVPTLDCMASFIAVGSGVERLALYSGGCAALTPEKCSGAGGSGAGLTHQISAGGTYYVRVRGGMTTAFVLDVHCPSPPTNDACAQATPVFLGANPPPIPGAPDPTFSSDGALLDAPTTCSGSTPAVWFSYTATTTGPACVTTADNGLPSGSLTHSVIAVYEGSCGGLTVACDDPLIGDELQALACFTATAGTTYYVRVSGPDGVLGGGTFRLFVTQPFLFELTSPLGPGSLEIRHWNGAAAAPYLTIITLNAGAYPAGPFFGIDPLYYEPLLQWASLSPPFVGFLSPAGTSLWGPVTGLPPITLYAVSIEFGASGYVSRVSWPVAHAVL